MRVAVLLAVTLAGACSGKSGAEAARRSAEQEQIRLAVARAVEALNAGDVEAMVAMHTSDAVVLKPHARPERAENGGDSDTVMVAFSGSPLRPFEGSLFTQVRQQL